MAAVAGIYAPWVVEPGVCFELEPPSEGVMAGRIAEVLAAGYPWLVAERDGRVCAYAYASRLRQRPAYDWVAETSVYVDRELVGAGLGAEVYSALLDILAIQRLRWAYAAIVTEAGATRAGASERFHARVGFEPFARFPRVGFKHGRWWDVAWWRFELGEDGEPEAIRSIHDPSTRAAISERLAWG